MTFYKRAGSEGDAGSSTPAPWFAHQQRERPWGSRWRPVSPRDAFCRVSSGQGVLRWALSTAPYTHAAGGPGARGTGGCVGLMVRCFVLAYRVVPVLWRWCVWRSGSTRAAWTGAGGATEPPADLHDVAGARLMMLAGLLWIIMTQEEDSTGFLLPPNCHVSGGGECSALDPALSAMVIFI